MEKFTFKLDNRMKLVAEKISPRINLFTVKGKKDYVFRLNSKKTKELVQVFVSVSTYGLKDLRCDLTKSEHNVVYFILVIYRMVNITLLCTVTLRKFWTPSLIRSS